MSTKTIRKLSDVQSSTGVILSGSLLERQIDDAVEHINNIPASDVRTGKIANTLLFGYTGLSGNGVNVFLESYNSNFSCVTVGANFANPERAKCHIHKECLIWTIPLYFSNPVILDEVVLSILTDSNYTGVFVDNTMTISISLDDQWGTEDRKLNSVVYQKQVYNHADKFRSVVAAPVSDMLPNDSENIDGRYVWSRQISEPLPANSRIRIFISKPYIGSWSIPRLYSWGVNITVLEETI